MPRIEDRNKEYLATAWKQHTVLEIARHIGATAAWVSKYYDGLGIEPITHRDRIASRVLDLHKKLTVTEIVTLLDCSDYLVREIMEEFGLAALTKWDLKNKSKVINSEWRNAKQEQKVYTRPPKVYNQSGSSLTDALHGIITTVRETTYASNVH